MIEKFATSNLKSGILNLKLKAPMPRPKLKLSITTRPSIKNPKSKIQHHFLRTHLLTLLTHLQIQKADWSITLVSDAAMTALHARTMNIATTTDVLTFDLRSSPTDPLELDTVICFDEAARRSTELKHPVTHELLLYAIHSLLHTQGYDDRTRYDAQKMHRREDQLLQLLGLPPVYVPKPKKH